MATGVKQKIPGRSRTGSALMKFRADPVVRASIIRWAEKQPDTPTLPEAIRRLVELGLTIRTKMKQRCRPIARAERRHRLVKGPSEFRQDRSDPPRTNRK